MRSTRNLNINKTQQDILRRAMAPFVGPAALAALARKSAKDLESALSALRGVQWEKHMKHISSAKKERQRMLNRTSTSESTESERTVTTLSNADTIMMNARRKQSILLDLVIMLQAQWRLYIARKRYTRFRRTVLRLQRRFRKIPEDAPWTTDDPNPRAQLNYIMVIQRNVRGFLARKEVEKRKRAVTTIQRNIARYAAQLRFTRQRAGALMIQKHIKSRRDRFAYEFVRILICRLQARIRGYMVRKRIIIILNQEWKLFRQEIVCLWQASHVSLSLRTNFWPILCSSPTFARLRIAENEIRRLWALLGIDLEGKGLSFSDRATAFADSIGVVLTTYRICHELSLFTTHDKPFESLNTALGHAYSFEEAERLQIYQRLNTNMSEKDTESIYKEFGIPSCEKKKKVALARAVCKYKS